MAALDVWRAMRSYLFWNPIRNPPRRNIVVSRFRPMPRKLARNWTIDRAADSVDSWDSPRECDGCGSTEDESSLIDDCGLLVCTTCIADGIVSYVRSPVMSDAGVIAIYIEYNNLKNALLEDGIIEEAFSMCGITSASIASAGPFDIDITLSTEDAIMFKLKNLEVMFLSKLQLLR